MSRPLADAPEAVSRPLRRALLVATAAFALLGSTLLVLSWRHLSATWDESNHLGAGLEWWQHGRYSWWTENPPLPRVALAALPYLGGMRLPDKAEWDPARHIWIRAWTTGAELLHTGAGYETNLRRARMGVFPFYLVALAAAFALGGGRRRPLGALVAVALIATLPAMIGNGAVAATDVPFVGMFLLFVLALTRYLDEPSRRAAIALGAALAGALLAKFSTLACAPIAAGALVVARRLAGASLRPGDRTDPRPWRAFAGDAVLGAAAAALVTWAGYGFGVGRIADLTPEIPGWMRLIPRPGEQSALARFLLSAHLPAHELFHGLIFFFEHNRFGHGSSYLLEEVSRTGFRSFFPIALAVKTPLPFLLLSLVGLGLIARCPRRRENAAAVGLALSGLAVLAISIVGRVNIGSRHVLIVVPLIAIAAALACAEALSRWRGRRRLVLATAVGIALAWQAGIAVRAHPNNLSYFNPLAGREPARVLLSSDLDWGQGLLQLRAETRARGIDRLKLAYFGVDKPCHIGLPAIEVLPPGRPVAGWIAVSENYYRGRSHSRLLPNPCEMESSYGAGTLPRRPFAWLEAHQPVAIVADSIRLYHIAP